MFKYFPVNIALGEGNLSKYKKFVVSRTIWAKKREECVELNSATLKMVTALSAEISELNILHVVTTGRLSLHRQ